MNEEEFKLYTFNNKEKDIIYLFNLIICRVDNKIVLVKGNKTIIHPNKTITIEDIEKIIFS
jgi:hypothetical protein